MVDLSRLPSVDKVLLADDATALAARYGRPLTLRAIRLTLESARQALADGGGRYPGASDILEDSGQLLAKWTASFVRGVINATGVILHTNLGRAPLSRSAISAMADVAARYSTLELDLSTGKRGSRADDVQAALQLLTGGEAALVVNNNAAAVLLVLSALAARKRVAIARSQLVEIGGGFRMPDVMRASTAKLVEVGTTNKVRLSDFEAVFGETSVTLRVHRSNFKLVGFTGDPDLGSLATAAHKANQILVDDLGSGSLLDTGRYGLAHEPTVQESIMAGADLVCFSGDKLLGGPQAGIILGRKTLLERISRHPLARALRADKMTLAGVFATLVHYLQDEAEQEIPVWQMISMLPDLARQRAEDWSRSLGVGEVRSGESTLGGGSLPGESLPTNVLSIVADRPDVLVTHLRKQSLPIIARTEKGRVLLDPRTVLPSQDRDLIAGLRLALEETT